jgi:hypothetical protein
MRVIKNSFNVLVFLLMMFSFSQCASTKKVQLQDEFPVEFGEVYFQKWTSGIKEGGSGFDFYIYFNQELPINIDLDSIYFRDKGAKLKKSNASSKLFIAHFKEINKNQVVLSNEPNAEYNNKLPLNLTKQPFELKSNQCVISYVKDSVNHYYKFSEVIEKEPLLYPSAPNNKQ